MSLPNASMPVILSVIGASLSPFMLGLSIVPFVVLNIRLVLFSSTFGSPVPGVIPESKRVFPVESISFAGSIVYSPSFGFCGVVVVSYTCLIANCTI